MMAMNEEKKIAKVENPIIIALNKKKKIPHPQN